MDGTEFTRLDAELAELDARPLRAVLFEAADLLWDKAFLLSSRSCGLGVDDAQGGPLPLTDGGPR